MREINRKLAYLQEYMGLSIDRWPDKMVVFDKFVKQKEAERSKRNELAKKESEKHYCYYCLRKMEGIMTVDHVVPTSRGGTDSKENKVYSCVYCNKWKDDKTIDIWREEVRRLHKKEKLKEGYTMTMYGNIIGRLGHLQERIHNNKKVSKYKT